MSSLHLKPFAYFEPATVEDAVKLLDLYGDQARILAGGIDLIPRMRAGNIKADYVINIQNIAKLEFLNIDEIGLEFGAMTKLHSLELSQSLRNDYPTLYEAIHQITSLQSKFMGTAVGNICLATPASDVATALMSLDAVLMIAGVKGQREERIADFYTDYRRTTLNKDEMVIGVKVPKPSQGTGAAFMNLVRTHADIAKITVAVAVNVEAGVCNEARIAVGAAAPTVFRAVSAEKILTGHKIDPELILKASEAAAASAKPITDFRSTEEYRREMTRVLVGRALTKAYERAGY